jgi:hypothetical protein
MNYLNTTFKRNATKVLTLLVILLASVNAWAFKPYTEGDIEQVTLAKNGWNLIGNPYTFKVKVNKAFVELDHGEAVIGREANYTINPCMGIAVYGNAGDKTTDYESRFKLVFATNNQGGASTGSAAFAFISNGNIIITADVADATLQIMDVLGRVVREGDAMNSVSTGGFVPGVYVLRLINGNDVKTQKMVIQ